MDSAKEEEIAKKLGINLEALKKEQARLSKEITTEDSVDFESIEFIGSMSNVIIGNKILSAIVVVDRKMEVVEERFFIDRVRFPYIAEFRSYRELPTMIRACEQLEQRPELVLIEGLGINHSRLGEASHFSISTGIPSIAITDNPVEFSIDGDKIYLKEREVGRVVQSKQGSKPLFVSPGSGISIETSAKIVRSLIRPPHKLPEVMKLARKYAKKISKEVFGKED